MNELVHTTEYALVCSLDAKWHYVQFGMSQYKVAFQEKNTVPLEYRLNIVPDLLAATFRGSATVKIRPNSNDSTKAIELDSHQLIIHSVTVSTGDKKRKAIQSTSEIDLFSDKLTVRTKRRLSYKSLYDVKIDFSGLMHRRNPFGFAIYQSDDDK